MPYAFATNTYTRMVHLDECLDKFDNTDKVIPQDIIENIQQEMIKSNISNSDLNTKNCRHILKKLNNRKYYEYVLLIISRINSTEPLKIKDNDKTKIRKVFCGVAQTYCFCRPPNRINFFNYNYVIHRICEMIGLHEYLDLFPLLKSPTKLLENNLIWQNLCKYNYDGWKDYPYYNKVMENTIKKINDNDDDITINLLKNFEKKLIIDV